MKREYFGMLFIFLFAGIIFLSFYLFDAIVVQRVLADYVVVWLILAYTAGQISMRYPKRF